MPLGDAFDLLQMVDVVTGHLMKNPIHGERAVLGMRQRLRARVPNASSVCARCASTCRADHLPGPYGRSNRSGLHGRRRASMTASVSRIAASGSRPARSGVYGVIGVVMIKGRR